ncbi:unnamed protein product [Adineta steineri]|uniref:Uncharacterized protein n=1 Tax=Adineta steineri TaxID=433720 RepID=A0A818VDB2_9BILA|nr:unnamed protein product [Adineta steineri]
MPSRYKYNSDDDSDHYERDPGREVIEKNTRNRLQRIADQTKDELNKVLKRVDATLNSYENSVLSSLTQHGMTRDEQASVEHLADIQELENLLNDTLAKQKYKQRLTVFIVGQTELASEKAALLIQLQRFFNDQKQSFSGDEFNVEDTPTETLDEVDIMLSSFDAKDCFIHVKQLGTKLSELNEDIIQYLIQNALARTQLKGKKKLAQATKESKDQVSALQQKLETAYNDINNKDNKIDTLEKTVEKLQRDLKSKSDFAKQLQQDVIQNTLQMQSLNKNITDLTLSIKQYEDQIAELQKTISQMEQDRIDEENNRPVPEPIIIEKIIEVPVVPEKEEVPEKILHDRETQTLHQRPEIARSNYQISADDSVPDLNAFFNVTDDTDLNNVTNENLPVKFMDLRKFAVIRVKELQKELAMNGSTDTNGFENLKQEYKDHKIACEKERNILTEKANNAHELQVRAEEALSHLETILAKHNKPIIHQQTQTDEDTHDSISTPDSIPIIEVTNHLSDSDDDNLADDDSKDGRRTASIENYKSFIEERKNQLGHHRNQPDPASRRTSRREETPVISIEMITQDEQQQTSAVTSRCSTRYSDKFFPQTTQTDERKLPFFYLYDMVYKFRQSIINLLEHNKWLTFADRLTMIKQLSTDDHYTSNDYIENSDRVITDTWKVLHTFITHLLASINEYKRKESEIVKEPVEPPRETSLIEEQQALLLEQKESMIIDLTAKYEQLTNALNQINTKHEEESAQNERLAQDQQKLIQNLQQQIIRLQKRLTKIEVDGVIEPSIMFTRLDAERNEQTLQQAVHKGKVLETTYNELNEAMENYVRLPSQQFANLVKRYIHFRKATELEDRIQSDIYDNETKDVLEKMESFCERRADEISKHMLGIRQERTHLAEVLTEKFDNLEDENSIFLIRPLYSYQGRAATQNYMKQEKRRRETISNENEIKKSQYASRQSTFPYYQYETNKHITTPTSSVKASDEDERVFNIDQSVVKPRSSPTRQHYDPNGSDHTQQFTIQLGDMTKLQEYDIQRTMMPISHTSTPLLSAFANNSIDPCVPSLNLRSYLALQRPGVTNSRTGKTTEVAHTVSREGASSVSGKNRTSDVYTPFNSTNGDVRRTSPQLPPIKRTPNTNEKQYPAFVNTTEVSSTT